MESVFYAKRCNDTIFFAGLATKKTKRLYLPTAPIFGQALWVEFTEFDGAK
jgi:hypothetical protein